MDKETALKLYKSLALSHFDYCDTVFMTATETSLRRLQLLQNSACRAMLLSAKDAHISDMHRELGLLYLNARRNLHFSLQIHKTVYSDSHTSLSFLCLCSMLTKGPLEALLNVIFKLLK